MGITVGGGGGGGSRKRRQRRIEPGQPVKPFQPIQNPFLGETPAFELGVYEILEEKDDYLICKGWDPQTRFPFGQIPPSAVRQHVKIAKPSLLLKTPWDGETVTIKGVDYTYDYDDTEIGKRTVTWTDDDGDHEEEQTIDPPYFVGDVIVAVEVRKTQIQRQSGMIVNDTKVKDEDDAYLQFVDLNFSGRHWKRPAEGGGGGTWIVEITEVLDGCECIVAKATVYRAPCDRASDIGTEVTIYDDLGCDLSTHPADEWIGVKAVVVETVGLLGPYEESPLPEGCDTNEDGYTPDDWEACHFSIVRVCCP